MTASERSVLGFARQTTKGTPNTTDGDFKYLLFIQGAMAPNSTVLPLDQEVGGGAMLRDMVRVGVVSGGQLELIPRPNTLGEILAAVIGVPAAGEPVPDQDGAYKHTFKLPTDQFDAPYYTVRSAPGGMWGEQFPDCRFSALALEFQAANFVRGTLGILGGTPEKVDHTGWNAAADGGPQLITAVSEIELPTSTKIKVLGGTFTAGMAIPLDEQWIIGSYSPDAFDINSRAYALTFNVKIDDGALYTKMSYDPSGGSQWVADLFREANFKLLLKSNKNIPGTTQPYSMQIAGNGQSGNSANVVWAANPVGIRAGRQVTMQVTGMFLGVSDGDPITVELINDVASYAA